MSREVRMGLGSRLRVVRKNLGLTLSQLSKKSKISKAYLSQLENEQFSNPSTEVIVKLCSALGVSFESIIGSKDISPNVFSGNAIPIHLRAIAQEENLNEQDLSMLSNIHFRGKQPNSPDGWRYVIDAIKRSIEDEK